MKKMILNFSKTVLILMLILLAYEPIRIYIKYIKENKYVSVVKLPILKKEVNSSIIYIGDSGTPLLSDTFIGNYGIGWTCENLKASLKSTLDTNITIVVLSIGTNDLYLESTDVEGTIKSINMSFPKAQIIAVTGSYGWGNAKNIDPLKYLSFYDRMKVKIVPGFGYKSTHPTLKDSKKIKERIRELIKE